MSLIGNIIWIIIGGLPQALIWLLSGIICYLTIIGIPVGKQCFKLAKLQFAPFGKEVVTSQNSVVGILGNILWLIFFGWELAVVNLAAALTFAVTIIGIPFALQSIKLAKLSLFPFGKKVVKNN